MVATHLVAYAARLGKIDWTVNTELNDLGKKFCLRKSEILLKEFQFMKSLKIWWNMAHYTAFHDTIPKTSQ